MSEGRSIHARSPTHPSRMSGDTTRTTSPGTHIPMSSTNPRHDDSPDNRRQTKEMQETSRLPRFQTAGQRWGKREQPARQAMKRSWWLERERRQQSRQWARDATTEQTTEPEEGTTSEVGDEAVTMELTVARARDETTEQTTEATEMPEPHKQNRDNTDARTSHAEPSQDPMVCACARPRTRRMHLFINSL